MYICIYVYVFPSVLTVVISFGHNDHTFIANMQKKKFHPWYIPYIYLYHSNVITIS